MDELTSIEPSELSESVECGICLGEAPIGKAHSVRCCMCHNFSICMPCFDAFISRQGPIEYYGMCPRGLSVQCPYCRAHNGFAYWSVIFRNAKPSPMVIDISAWTS